MTKAVAASSPYVLQDAKKKHMTVKCGKCYLQWLPGDSLFQDSVQAALLVHGPNMHVKHKPNCMEGDYETGKELYRECVRSMLECFVSATQLKK